MYNYLVTKSHFLFIQHLQSLELHGSDKAGKEGKDKKKEWKFFYDRGSGGKYIFRVRAMFLCVERERGIKLCCLHSKVATTLRTHIVTSLLYNKCFYYSLNRSTLLKIG